MSKKSLALPAVLAAGALALAACGGSSSSSSSSSTSSGGNSTAAASSSAASPGDNSWCGDDGVITVGFAKAATGFFAFFDTPAANGAKLAFEEVNKTGGIGGCTFKSIDADAKGDPAVGGQVAQELIDKGAEILFVPNDFDLGVAAAQAGQAAGILTISDGASSTQFASAVGDLMFNGGLTSTDTVAGQVAFTKEKGWTNYYGVSLDAFALFKEQMDGYRAASGAKEDGLTIVAPDAADFAQPISKARKDLAPENSLIYANIFYPGAATFIKQTREAGLTTPILGNKDYYSPDLAKASGGAKNLSNVYYVTFAPNASALYPEVDAFVKAYQATYGTSPESSMAMNAYQIAFSVIDAVRTASSVEGSKLAEAMRGQKNLKVPGGEIIGWKDGYTMRKVFVIDAASEENGGVVAEYLPQG